MEAMDPPPLASAMSLTLKKSPRNGEPRPILKKSESMPDGKALRPKDDECTADPSTAATPPIRGQIVAPSLIQSLGPQPLDSHSRKESNVTKGSKGSADSGDRSPTDKPRWADAAPKARQNRDLDWIPARRESSNTYTTGNGEDGVSVSSQLSSGGRGLHSPPHSPTKSHPSPRSLGAHSAHGSDRRKESATSFSRSQGTASRPGSPPKSPHSIRRVNTTNAPPPAPAPAPAEQGVSVLRWRKGPLIGSGGFGKVYIGLNETTGNLLAIKVIELSHRDTKVIERLTELQQEIKVLKHLMHPHIVGYVTSDRVGEAIYVFMEYVPGGSLYSLLKDFGALSEVTTANYAQQIIDALEYLHSNNVVHRDVKSANVLVSVAGDLKLSDFGSSAFTNAAAGNKPGMVGTSFWMAPEVLTGGFQHFPADIWALGCTVVEMLSAKTPFYHIATTGIGVMRYVGALRGKSKVVYLPAGMVLNEDVEEFLGLCFVVAPERRASAAELATQPFIVNSAGNELVRDLDPERWDQGSCPSDGHDGEGRASSPISESSSPPRHALDSPSMSRGEQGDADTYVHDEGVMSMHALTESDSMTLARHPTTIIDRMDRTIERDEIHSYTGSIAPDGTLPSQVQQMSFTGMPLEVRHQRLDSHGSADDSPRQGSLTFRATSSPAQSHAKLRNSDALTALTKTDSDSELLSPISAKLPRGVLRSGGRGGEMDAGSFVGTDLLMSGGKLYTGRFGGAASLTMPGTPPRGRLGGGVPSQAGRDSQSMTGHPYLEQQSIAQHLISCVVSVSGITMGGMQSDYQSQVEYSPNFDASTVVSHPSTALPGGSPSSLCFRGLTPITMPLAPDTAMTNPLSPQPAANNNVPGPLVAEWLTDALKRSVLEGDADGGITEMDDNSAMTEPGDDMDRAESEVSVKTDVRICGYAVSVRYLQNTCIIFLVFVILLLIILLVMTRV
eukprot:TRINITY_DN5402_c0_g1_i1.p1 TRINITY_DN5402_c0_g1~~TRINITY_DN5402_c0_g1_i1.p1  ORF type:complete len:954 (+),score=282.19 TRINITY_DN5402_c0_g1_i1:165-3026(+)